MKTITEFLVNKPITHNGKTFKVYNHFWGDYYVRIKDEKDLDLLLNNSPDKFNEDNINEVKRALPNHNNVLIRPAIRYNSDIPVLMYMCESSENMIKKRYEYVKDITEKDFNIKFWKKNNWDTAM